MTVASSWIFSVMVLCETFQYFFAWHFYITVAPLIFFFSDFFFTVAFTPMILFCNFSMILSVTFFYEGCFSPYFFLTFSKILAVTFQSIYWVISMTVSFFWKSGLKNRIFALTFAVQAKIILKNINVNLLMKNISL